MITSEYLDSVGDHIMQMRLVIEGALTMYEGPASDLCRQAGDSKQAAYAFNLVGSALYALRQTAIAMHEEYARECEREP